MFFSTLRASILGLFVLLPMSAFAQGQSPPAAADQQLLKAEELDALVAPIALYPDTLLAEVLMASTYPLEVVQADRWATENKALKGDQLKAAVDKQVWDDSVKSLVATPSVLSMMSTKLDWTQKLGDAVLAQQPDVMDAVQRLRTKAQANNKLQSTKEQKVSVKQEQSKQVIVIEPAVPDTVYVPYYDPGVVYGGWPYPSYPPYYFPPPLGYVPGAILATGIAFGAGYAVGRWASGGYWGGGVNWGNNNINVNRNTNINNINAGGNWQHNPQHRQGVKYNNTGVQQKFGNNNARGGSQDRMDFRGRGGDQVLKPGGGQANLGDRGGAGNRPGGGSGGAANRPGGGAGSGAANRPGGGSGAANRPSGGGGGAQRPSGGQKPSAGQRPAGGGGNALGNIQSGRTASAQSARGHASMGGGGGGARAGGGGGGARAGGGGGGARGGGGGGGGGRGGGGGGGGRRSDIALKHDIVLLGHLNNGLGFYRFAYDGSSKPYVGVMAQEVQNVRPDAVRRGPDGYLRVYYDKLGVRFQTYQHWIASGARVPATSVSH
jgi:uncharacterized protein DUF3300/endosialidase-like protein